eukprot:3221437-Prymnesium_polylepis.3
MPYRGEHASKPPNRGTHTQDVKSSVLYSTRYPPAHQMTDSKQPSTWDGQPVNLSRHLVNLRTW